MDYDPESFDLSDWIICLVNRKSESYYFVKPLNLEFSAVIGVQDADNLGVKLADIIKVKIIRNKRSQEQHRVRHKVLECVCSGPSIPSMPTSVRSGNAIVTDTATPIAFGSCQNNWFVLKGHHIERIYDKNQMIPVHQMDNVFSLELMAVKDTVDKTRSVFIVVNVLQVLPPVSLESGGAADVAAVEKEQKKELLEPTDRPGSIDVVEVYTGKEAHEHGNNKKPSSINILDNGTNTHRFSTNVGDNRINTQPASSNGRENFTDDSNKQPSSTNVRAQSQFESGRATDVAAVEKEQKKELLEPRDRRGHIDLVEVYPGKEAHEHGNNKHPSSINMLDNGTNTQPSSSNGRANFIDNSNKQPSSTNVPTQPQSKQTELLELMTAMMLKQEHRDHMREHDPVLFNNIIDILVSHFEPKDDDNSGSAQSEPVDTKDSNSTQSK